MYDRYPSSGSATSTAMTCTPLGASSSVNRARLGCAAAENGQNEATNARTTTDPRSDERRTVFPSWSRSAKSGARAPGWGDPISGVTPTLAVAGSAAGAVGLVARGGDAAVQAASARGNRIAYRMVSSVGEDRVPREPIAYIGGSPYLRPDLAPRLIAWAAAAARFFRPSLARTFPTWCSTVFGLMNRRLPISALDRP